MCLPLIQAALQHPAMAKERCCACSVLELFLQSAHKVVMPAAAVLAPRAWIPPYKDGWLETNSFQKVSPKSLQMPAALHQYQPAPALHS